MEQDNLRGFTQTDHYQLSQMAKPIITKMQSLMPVPISWGNITYGYLNGAASRTIAQITYHQHNLNGPVGIRLQQVFRDPNLHQETIRELVHELAHLGAMRWKGEAELGHGFYWGYLMIAMGYEPSRCVPPEVSIKLHQAKRAAAKPETIFADCPTCGETKFFNMGKDYHYHCETCHGTERK